MKKSNFQTVICAIIFVFYISRFMLDIIRDGVIISSVMVKSVTQIYM